MAKTKNIENEKLVSILTYFLVGIIWYFVDEKMKKSSHVKFHAKQSLNLFIISIVFNVAFGIIGSILAFTIILVPFIILIEVVFSLVILVLWVIGLINSINGKEKDIPIIGSYANKYLKF